METQRLRLFLCGDVMTGRGVDQVLPHPVDPKIHERWVGSATDYVRLAERRNGPIPRPADWTYIWGAALEALAERRPDLRIVNLETSITTSSDFVPKGINYRMSPANAACLEPLKPDCCVLANNHVLDWGRDGLVETLAVLQRLGIATAGAGRDAAEARAPAILQGPGATRVIVAAFCAESSGVPADWTAGPNGPGVNLVQPGLAAARRLARDLEPVRRAGDIVVASIHWGPNWGYAVPSAHRRFARALVELADVSVVHGHSSHHPLAIEVHQRRLVLYGCGDFLNDYEGIGGHEAFRADLSLMYFADLEPGTGALAALEMVPLQMRRFRLERPADRDIDWLRQRLAREYGRFGGRVERRGSEFALLPRRRAGPPLNEQQLRRADQ